MVFRSIAYGPAGRPRVSGPCHKRALTGLSMVRATGPERPLGRTFARRAIRGSEPMRTNANAGGPAPSRMKLRHHGSGTRLVQNMPLTPLLFNKLPCLPRYFPSTHVASVRRSANPTTRTQKTLAQLSETRGANGRGHTCRSGAMPRRERWPEGSYAGQACEKPGPLRACLFELPVLIHL